MTGSTRRATPSHRRLGVNLLAGGSSSDRGSDVLVWIENLIGGNFNDGFVGTDGVNVLRGGGGNDTMLGRLATTRSTARRATTRSTATTTTTGWSAAWAPTT